MKKYSTPEIEIVESINVVCTSGEIDFTYEDRNVETPRFNFG